MKRMLFNATQAEELRVAIVDGQKLIDLDIESAAKEQRKSNIYKGVVTRVEPSLEAAFVNYGEDRHGFLPFKEISRAYFLPGVEPSKARIQDVIKEGRELIVQVEKDERGNKGAALTTFVSLAGRYLVLMPNNPRGGGVSRRVEGDERTELREAMDQLEVPQGMSLIARTAAIGRTAEELQWDLNYLMQLWTAIEGAAKEQNGPFLIYLEGSLVIRAIRDYFQPDIGEILIDTDDVFEQARAFMGTVMPPNISRVKRYRDDVPLFSRFQIEHQIESAYSRQVNLPSGGAVVIDHTEALVAVDVNSGRATRGADIEETAFKTNLEAADELARQLRLRDLGGLIVIDFIDMESTKNQREVENRLRDALRHDRARVQMGKISRFGLMELSRQRLRPALAETSYIPCPRCTGTGHIRSTESAALHILRILEEEAMKENTGAVHTQVPVDVATFLLNEKRADIQAIEVRHKVRILLIPNIHLETPQHSIVRLRHDEISHDEPAQLSYRMVEAPAEESEQPRTAADARQTRQQAAIKQITPEKPAPIVEEKPRANAAPAPAGPGLLDRILGWFRSAPATTEVSTEKKEERSSSSANRGQRDGQRRRGGRRDEEREGREPRQGRAPKEGRDANKETGREGGKDSSRDDASREAAREARQQAAARPLAAASDNGEEAAPAQRSSRRQRGGRREQTGNSTATAVAAATTTANLSQDAGTPQAQEVQPLVAALTTPAADLNLAADTDVSAEVAANSERSGGRRRGRRGGRRGERSQEENNEAGSLASAAPVESEVTTAAGQTQAGEEATSNRAPTPAVVAVATAEVTEVAPPVATQVATVVATEATEATEVAEVAEVAISAATEALSPANVASVVSETAATETAPALTAEPAAATAAATAEPLLATPVQAVSEAASEAVSEIASEAVPEASVAAAVEPPVVAVAASSEVTPAALLTPPEAASAPVEVTSAMAAPSAATVQESPAAEASVEPAEAALPAAAPAVDGPAEAALPVAKLEAILEQSGLVMVETKAASTPAATPTGLAQAQTPVPANKPRRRRQTVAAAAEEPMVMVETKKS